MRLCDEHTIKELHVPSRTLMERAARTAVSCLLARPLVFPAGTVLVLCGSGNNGGDGLAAARFLADGSQGESRPVTVVYLGRLTPDGLPDTERMSQECARQYALAQEAGIPILPPDRAEDALSGCCAVVDAVFGIGLDRPVEGAIGAFLRRVSEAGRPVLAIDIPSGVYADTGAVPGTALSASVTVTMQALKPGLLLYPGAAHSGEVVVADIGIDLSPAVPPAKGHRAYLVGEDILQAVLPSRNRRSHKGTYGRLSLLCGSYGMAGAAVLSASAALRCGVGLAQVITPADNRVILQTALPEALLTLYDRTSPDLTALLVALANQDGLVAGCGLGTTETACTVLRTVLSGDPLAHREPPLPLVLDADALTLLSKHPDLWACALLADPHRQVVITPHPAEMARLCGRAVGDILNDLPGTALAFARSSGAVVVLKDAHTVIASPDGQVWICTAGNAGMAKGGSGDVLAGIIGSLLVQNRHRLGLDLSVGQVAAAGVLLHAMAGDKAAEAVGEYGLLASDTVAALSAVTRPFSDSRTPVGQVGYPLTQ
jgi:NAD(P)H-hydrate epimerase